MNSECEKQQDYAYLRKALLQMDRKQTRKKAQSLLNQGQRLDRTKGKINIQYVLGRIMLHYVDHNYLKCSELCQALLSTDLDNDTKVFVLSVLGQIKSTRAQHA